MTQSTSVSILCEIPEELHEALRVYLETHPNWDQNRTFTAALSCYLLNNIATGDEVGNDAHHKVSQVYIDTLFKPVDYTQVQPSKEIFGIANLAAMPEADRVRLMNELARLGVEDMNYAFSDQAVWGAA
jgi:Protein of unknown function (DUF2811)